MEQFPFSLYEGLKEQSSEFCTNYFWENSPNPARALIQYYIDLMRLDYQLTEEDQLQTIEVDLVLRISESEEKAEDDTGLKKTQEFIQAFFNKAFEVDKVEDIVSTSISFLNAYIDNEEISDDHSKAVSCLLLVFHVKPLAQLLEMLANNTADPLEASMNIELDEMLIQSLKDIMRNITVGLKFKKYSDQIAMEFFDNLEIYNNIFVSDELNYLCKLRDFLIYDNNTLLRIAVMNIKKLLLARQRCFKELKIIILQTVNNLTLIEAVVHLIMTRSIFKGIAFLSDAICLLIEIKKFNLKLDIIPRETRIEIYAKIFPTRSLSLQTRLLQMMMCFEDDLLLAYVMIFNKLNASQSLIEKVIISTSYLKQPMLPQLIDIITQNIIRDENIALRACQVFTLTVKNVACINESKVFAKLPLALQACMENETMFSALLHFIIYLDPKKIKYQLTDNIKVTLVSTLLTAFNDFDDIKVLQLIMKVLAKLAKVITREIVIPLNETFKLEYDEFLRAETSLVVDGGTTIAHDNSLVKMCLMLESNIINFLDYFSFEAVVVINEQHLQDTDDPMFSLFVRLKTVVLQALWSCHVNALLKNLPVPVLPFDLKFVVDSVEDLAKKLLSLLNRRDWNLLQARNIFCSLMKLLFNFFVRPTLVKRDQCSLSVSQPKVTSHQMREIVKFAKYYIFQITPAAAEGTDMESYYNVESQKVMLDSLSELVKNYSTLPNVTYLFKIVKFYKNESVFKDEIELLLKFLLELNKTFDYTVGLVIIHFAKQKCSKEEFTQFSQALEKFLNRLYSKYEVSNIKWHVSAFVAKQLPSIINLMPLDEENDRLALILELLRIFCQGMNPESMNQLNECLPEDFKQEITAEEHESFEQFVAFLSSKTSSKTSSEVLEIV